MLKDLHGRLRPLGIADILDETVDLYRSNFVLLMGISGVLNVPYAVLSGLLGETQAGGGPTGLMFSLIAAFVIGSIVTGALTFAISDRYTGKRTSVGASYRRVLKGSVFWPLLGAVILKNLVVFGPMVFAAVAGVAAAVVAGMQGSPAAAAAAGIGMLGIMGLGGIWAAYFGTRFLLVEPAVILEQFGAIGALSRSWNLVAGNMWKGFGLFVIVTVVMLLVVLTITGPTTFAITSKTMAGEPVSQAVLAIHTILTAIVQTLVAPWSSIAWILLYYDMRIRKEGFDLELLARELDERAREFRSQGAASLPQEHTTPEHSQQDSSPNE